MTRIPKLIVVVLSTMALLGVGLAQAQAQDDKSQAPESVDSYRDELPDVAAPQVGDAVDDAELEDLSRFAEQRGITLEQAVAENAWRFDFSLMAAEVREAVPDAFTYAAATGPRTAELWFSDEVPDQAQALVDNFSRHFPAIDLKLRPEVGLSESEINSMVVAAHFAVFERTGETTSEFRYEELTIVITVPRSAREAAGEMAAVAEQAMEKAVDRPLTDVRVIVEVSASEVLSGDTTASYHRGGELLTGCTSGPAFVNTSTGSRRGSTAGHCSNSQTDDGSSMNRTHDYNSTWGDFQLHWGNKWESDDFYSGSSTVTETANRDTSSGGTPVAGQVLCINGATTQKNCDYVEHPSVCANSNCYLIKMQNFEQDYGDSGAVSFYSRTIYGLDEGFTGGSHTTVSRQDSVHEAFWGWYLATS